MKSKFIEFTNGTPSIDPVESSTGIEYLEPTDNLQKLKKEILDEVSATLEGALASTYQNFEDRMHVFSDNVEEKLKEMSKNLKDQQNQSKDPERHRVRKEKPTMDEVFEKVTKIFEREDEIENLKNKLSIQIDGKIENKIEEISERIEVEEDNNNDDEIQKVYEILDDLKKKFAKMNENLFTMSTYMQETVSLRNENLNFKIEISDLKSEISTLKNEISTLKSEQIDLKDAIDKNQQQININHNLFEYKQADLSQQVCRLTSETKMELEYLRELTIHPKSMIGLKDNILSFQEKFEKYSKKVPTRDEDRHPGLHAEMLKGFKSLLEELLNKVEELRSEPDFAEQEHQIKILKRKLKNLDLNFESFRNNPLRAMQSIEAQHLEQHGRLKIYRHGKKLRLKTI